MKIRVWFTSSFVLCEQMRVVNRDVYRVNPELQKLREEIGSYRR